ncbi:oxygenase MpaB family protein [Lolliginicoccus levis]|uniref:oxygenase MpaB family protein n=1 Tax=Lolliginicoccus levis TaxID=2919542 RepID=UPI00241EF9AF|nr:oxygenase MpaB family protein [Lolliginicoccus levis]
MLGIKTRAALREEFAPHADNGFFGPGSVTWKVWSHPTSYVLGFARAVTIEHLDPNLAAAVVQAGGVRYRPHSRYGRTMRYFAMVAFGATEPTAKAADVLVKVHSKAIGNDPVTGGSYDANKPSSQLWIHMTAWHSILYCYEKFGPGRLSPDEEAQFWDECARAAELQTIDPATVPRTREDVIAYFEDWRPRLAASEAAQDMVDFILGLDVALPPDMPAWQRQALKPMLFAMRRGIIATYPPYMRKMLDIQQGPLIDLLITPPNKVIHAAMHRSINLTMLLMKLIAPAALEIAMPAVLGIPAIDPITMTPREAQAKYGYELPADAHQDLRARQQDRVFGAGARPSDEGLIESEQHLGALG